MEPKRRGRPAKAKEETTEATRPDSSNRSGRVRRSSVNSGRDRLNVAGYLDPNYVYRTVNDVGSRVDELKSYGYEVVQDKDVSYSTSNKIGTGTTRSVVVDRRTGQKGVLMRQPIEFHEEDKAAKEAQLKEREKSMFRKLKTDDGRYGDVDNTSSLARAVED